jgi:hypothetical protein
LPCGWKRGIHNKKLNTYWLQVLRVVIAFNLYFSLLIKYILKDENIFSKILYLKSPFKKEREHWRG